jgi:HEPN domain-containing protein
MPPDIVRVADTRAWLVKAATDLRAADHEFTAIPPLLGDVAFHCQQAAEKTLKGFLTWHNQPFRRTHNLEEIGEQCLAIDPSLENLIDLAAPLSEYAWAFRYPGDPDDPSEDEARAALDVARVVYRNTESSTRGHASVKSLVQR